MAFITEFWGLDGLIVFSLLIILAYLYMTRNFNYWKKRGVQEIPPIPFFGSFKDVILVKMTPGQWFANMYKAYASLPYVGFYILDKPFLMIRDREIIKHIFMKDSQNFLDKHLTANPKDALGEANLFMLKDPQWKYLRSKLTPVYTSGKLKKMFYLMLDVCNDLNVFLNSQNLEGDGGVLEMKGIAANFMTDMIVTTAFGVKANSLNNPDAEFRKHGRKMFAFTTYRGYEFLALFFAPHLAALLDVYFFQKENVSFLRDSFWSILEERRTSGIKRFDFIDLIDELRMNQTEEEKKFFALEGDNLVAQAAVFFLGGFETSSTTTSFALYEMALNQEIQDKLRREIQVALEKSNGELTFELVSSGLPYLNMVIAETLRIYAPLPFLDRVPANDYQIPGSDLILKKGTPIIIPVGGIHMDEEYYPEPHHFNPENFSEENQKARGSGVYMPFGDGPHLCIGKRYGLIQVKLSVITIISNYEVLPCKETLIPMKLNPSGLFTTSAGGIYLKVRKLVK